MRCSIAVFTSIVLAAAAPASAHRLDEYLQALRVDVRGDAVVLELDLTPGANLAADIVPVLDPDGDGAIDSIRSEAYASEVARSLELAIDGRRSTLALVSRQFPSVDELRAGSGVISFVMRADVAHAGGAHQLRVENGYRARRQRLSGQRASAGWRRRHDRFAAARSESADADARLRRRRTITDALLGGVDLGRSLADWLRRVLASRGLSVTYL